MAIALENFNSDRCCVATNISLLGMRIRWLQEEHAAANSQNGGINQKSSATDGKNK